jgi:hypothetical protein
MDKPIVYIASPYTEGDEGINVHFQCEIFNRLMDDKKVWPVAPMWAHFQHTIFPRPYQDWVAYDNAFLKLYDACLRLNPDYPKLPYKETRSKGADNEEISFKALGKPVFYSIEDLYHWVETGGVSNLGPKEQLEP